MSDVDQIIAYESGLLDAVETLTLFASLIRSGLAWSLQGHYGRTAHHLIESGYLTPAGAITDSAREAIETQGV